MPWEQLPDLTDDGTFSLTELLALVGALVMTPPPCS